MAFIDRHATSLSMVASETVWTFDKAGVVGVFAVCWRLERADLRNRQPRRFYSDMRESRCRRRKDIGEVTLGQPN